jgi:nicotinamide-nucleotide amidase
MNELAHFPGQEIVKEIADALIPMGKTVGVCAPPLTAGLITSTLCKSDSAQAWFGGGLIVANERLVTELALVDPAVIATHGLASEAVALAGAQGTRITLKTDYAVAVMGNAGHTAGDDHAPAGTVYIAVSGPQRERVWTRRLHGSPSEVRALAERMALHLLRSVLDDDTLHHPDVAT